MYTETHCVSHSSTRLKGDKRVNYVLDNRIQRESQHTQKQLITVLAEQHHISALNMNMVQGEIPTDGSELTQLETGGGVIVFDTDRPPPTNELN